MRTRACFAFSLLVLLVLQSIPGGAYTPSTTDQGILLRWANGTVIHFVGLYQVNARVPGGLPPGRVPVVISTSAGSSNQAMISVQ